MQELEKILEEIKGLIEKHKNKAYELVAREPLTQCYTEADIEQIKVHELAVVRDIIRKHMNDDTEIVEPCPCCGNEVALHWNVEEDGREVYCPYCGFPVMLCSMCDARDGGICDWEEEKGCKHSDERYRDYFCKNMNDGWIPV
jgi:hypothetical protein